MVEEKENNKFLKGINDLIFKEIFTSSYTREYASYVISYLTGLDYNYVFDNYTLSRNELSNENKNESKKTTDIIVKVGNNIINLEANNKIYPGLEERNEIYLATLMARIPKKTGDYLQLPNFYQINIDNFIRYNNDILKCKMYDEIAEERINSKVKIIHVSLEKIRKRCYYNVKLKGNIDFKDRLFLILVVNKKDLEQISNGNKMLEKVREKIMFLNEECDFNRVGEYDIEEEQERIRLTIANYVRREALKEGREEGREVGREEGREEGRAEGLKEGITRTNKSIALNMLKNKIDLSMISKCTGLSINEIKSLN